MRACQVVPVVKNPLANAGGTRDVGFHSWIGKIPWRRTWQPTPVFLPGESHEQRSLVEQRSPWPKWFSTHACICSVVRAHLKFRHGILQPSSCLVQVTKSEYSLRPENLASVLIPLFLTPYSQSAAYLWPLCLQTVSRLQTLFFTPGATSFSPSDHLCPWWLLLLLFRH